MTAPKSPTSLALINRRFTEVIEARGELYKVDLAAQGARDYFQEHVAPKFISRDDRRGLRPGQTLNPGEETALGLILELRDRHERFRTDPETQRYEKAKALRFKVLHLVHVVRAAVNAKAKGEKQPYGPEDPVETARLLSFACIDGEVIKSQVDIGDLDLSLVQNIVEDTLNFDTRFSPAEADNAVVNLLSQG